jgi:hypothetical protein
MVLTDFALAWPGYNALIKKNPGKLSSYIRKLGRDEERNHK